MKDEAKALKMPVESDFPDKASFDRAMREWWSAVEYREPSPERSAAAKALAEKLYPSTRGA